MPVSKPRPSEVAGEAKRVYHPYIAQRMPEDPAYSVVYQDCSILRIPAQQSNRCRLRVAIEDADPVDVAIGWKQSLSEDPRHASAAHEVAVINMANEKRAGGDWESGIIAPEECFARRSNLVPRLKNIWMYSAGRMEPASYPIPARGGVYSPSVVVFRDGPENYQIWKEFKSIPVISVAPVKRPKLDGSCTKYSFDQEKELMTEKMRSILRIAAYHGHKNLCMGAFGVGPGFRNPAAEVAKIWRTLLFSEDEFDGVFSNIVFAIQRNQGYSPKTGPSEYDIFGQTFHPSKIFQTPYLERQL